MATAEVQQILRSQPYWRAQELRERGVSDKAIRRLVRSRSLVRVRHGCYAPQLQKDSEWTPNAEDLLQVYRHATLTKREGGQVYSHTSSARLWGLHLWNVDDTIHLSQSKTPAGQRGPLLKVHQVRIPEDQITTRHGFRVTTLERSIVDSARVLGYRQGLILADHGLRNGADRQTMNSIADSLRGHKGIPMARAALGAASGLAESPGETLTRHFFHTMNLPVPVEQYAVETRLGQHRLDFAYPELMLAVEFDGKTKYFDYRPTSEALFNERRREKALTEMGWQFVRIEWADLFREAELKERILVAIARAERRR